MQTQGFPSIFEFCKVLKNNPQSVGCFLKDKKNQKDNSEKK